MRKWVPLLTVCLGSFMLLVDTTIVNIALPGMAHGLDASFTSLQWVIDAYALALASLVLAAGSIADLVGRRQIFVLGLIVFGPASMACGLAGDAAMLVLARAVQGVGAAAMLATTFPLLNSHYAGRERGVVYGLWGAVNGAASMAGPLIGGLLVQVASWRSIFFVNLPVTLLALALCRALRTDKEVAGGGSFDLLGTLSFAAAAAALTYGLILVNDHGWGSPAPMAWLATVPLFLAGFFAAEQRAQRPMFDLTLLRNRTLLAVLLGAGALTWAAFGAYAYTAIWMQSVRGMTPLAAGLVLVPLSATAFVVSAGIGRHLHGSRPRWIIGGGLLLIGAGGLITSALLHGAVSWPGLIPGSVVTGVGVGLATPTLASTAMAAVPIARGGMAAGAVNTMRQLGFALGIAILGTIVVGSVSAPSGSLNDTLQTVSLDGLHRTFLTCGAVGLLAGLGVLALIRTPRPDPSPLDAGTLAVEVAA